MFALAFLISVGVRALDGPVKNDNSNLHQVTNWIGTLVSGSFLYIIAEINVVILFGIIKVFRGMKTGRYNERQLEAQLDKRGFMNRFLGHLTKTVTKPPQMYPIGALFGLGFDTATEVALLVLAGGAAGAGLPWYAILCLPILFAAGMSLMDSIDGSFMNFAYGWAFSNPVRKIFYNITITGLSVAVAVVIGTIELGGLIASELNLSGSFWNWFENIDINFLGFVIVGMFVITWAVALSVWRYERIEEKWSRGVDRKSRRIRELSVTSSARPPSQRAFRKSIPTGRRITNQPDPVDRLQVHPVWRATHLPTRFRSIYDPPTTRSERYHTRSRQSISGAPGAAPAKRTSSSQIVCCRPRSIVPTRAASEPNLGMSQTSTGQAMTACTGSGSGKSQTAPLLSLRER